MPRVMLSVLAFFGQKRIVWIIWHQFRPKTAQSAMRLDHIGISGFELIRPWSLNVLYGHDWYDIYMPHGTIILFQMSIMKLS